MPGVNGIPEAREQYWVSMPTENRELGTGNCVLDNQFSVLSSRFSG
jgi:hypothetical protein